MRLRCKCLRECDNICRCMAKGRVTPCAWDISVPPVKEFLTTKQCELREGYLDDIRAALTRRNAVLAVGAGVSIPMNMPSWAGLISQLTGYALQYDDYKGKKDEEDKFVTAAEKAERKRLIALEQALMSGKLTLLGGINVLEAAQYIDQILKHSAGSDNDMAVLKGIIAAIAEKSYDRAALEKSYRKRHHLRQKDAVKDWDLIKDNSLLAVAYLLQAAGGFRQAMTYNYDTLIQQYLLSMFGVAKDRIVTHCESWSQSVAVDDPIELFHLHGCIPPKKEQGKYPVFPKESREIILSEDSYYNIERHSGYNWQNSIQSFFLNRDTCVFVGFSADDYNFRRILRQMGDRMDDKAPHHYLVLAIDDLVKDTWKSVCQYYLSEKAGETTRAEIRARTLTLLARELDMKAHYWQRYNFYPIWVTIQDIPEVLLSLLP